MISVVRYSDAVEDIQNIVKRNGREQFVVMVEKGYYQNNFEYCNDLIAKLIGENKITSNYCGEYNNLALWLKHG